MKVIFGWLMKISFSCILASTCVTSPPPLAVYHPVRNVHTGWMIPAIIHWKHCKYSSLSFGILQTQKISTIVLLLCTWYGTRRVVFGKEPSPVSWGSPHSVYTSFLGHIIVSLGLYHGTNLLQMLVQTSYSHLSWLCFWIFSFLNNTEPPVCMIKWQEWQMAIGLTLWNKLSYTLMVPGLQEMVLRHTQWLPVLIICTNSLIAGATSVPAIAGSCRPSTKGNFVFSSN